MGVLSRTMPDGEPRHKVTDPELKDERKTVFKMYFINFLCVTAALWCIISIYFGAYYRQTENAYRLTVRILDMDSQYARVVAGAPAAVMGPAVVQAAQNTIAAMPYYHLGYQFASEDELSLLKVTQDGQGLNASDYATNLVLNQDVFGVILINPNATVLATEAALNGITTYDPRGAVSFFYEEARNFYSENQYVSLHSTRIIEAAIAEASLEFVRELFNTAGATGTADTAALQTALTGNALTYPFYYNQHNLRPFDQLAAEAAVTAGQIYLIIFTFFMSPIWLKAFENLRRKLTLSSQLLVQWGVPVACYFWISLNYSLVTLAFKTDFTRKFGYGGFPLFWANNWLSMTALGFVMETMLRIAGPLYFPFFLLFWVVWNVSTAFLDLSDQDPFYMYGFAFPVWNSIDTSKSIIFGTKDHLLQNFMVNLGWVIGGSIALLCVVTYKRKKEERQELEERVKQRKEEQSS